MSAPFLELHVLTRQPRTEAVTRLKEALIGAGGWVTDYREFSNKTVCINVEIDERHCGELLERLRQVECVLEEETVRRLEGADPNRERTCVGALCVTLLHDDPDEKSVIPAVPG
jgi:hypothetical protein